MLPSYVLLSLLALTACSSGEDESADDTMSVNNVSQNWCDAWRECNAESFDISQESRAECVKDGIDELGDLLQGRSEDCGSAALTYFDCALPAVVCGNDDSSCLEEAEAATTACSEAPGVGDAGQPTLGINN